ncbi:MAG: TonB-dependent receptor plug domain-containing protein [Owenweeksia sp.]|nr:TonB-dependent receptor plug domain-containing protein [Owenweeksia sp.]
MVLNRSRQGLSGAKIKILVDGVPVIGRLDGNIDISQINLSNIERVEIVEGPMSVQDGTDAVAGTINLITKKDFTAEIKGQPVNAYYETAGRAEFGRQQTLSPWLKSCKPAYRWGAIIFNGYSPK